MLCHIARYFAAAGGVPNMNGILEIERGDEFGNVGGVRIHVVSIRRL